MSDFIILSLIGVLVVCLILTLVGFVFYSGLLSEVDIRTGSPPVKKITIAYKFKKGSYRECGADFTESYSIAPNLRTVGVYYDDPNQTPADCCRYAVGSILSENEEKPDEELQRLYEKFGFRIISFPEVSCAVTSTFPNRCSLSPICGAYRVFPALNTYVTERRLAAFPFLEICGGDLIHYMCPLENQYSFFVHELQEKQLEDEEKPKEGEENNDDKGDEVTETGESCQTESSAVIQEAGVSGTESREAMADLPVAQQSPEQDEGDGQSEEADQVAKSSSESVGSGSSFEELDMDTEEGEKERKNEEEGHVEDNEERA